MPSYLLCSSPIQGHVAPMLAIGQHLVARGHAVTMITGSRFQDAVVGIGAEHRSLSGAADYDDRTMWDDEEEKFNLRLMREGMETIFVLPMREQAHAMERAIKDLEPRDPRRLRFHGCRPATPRRPRHPATGARRGRRATGPVECRRRPDRPRAPTRHVDGRAPAEPGAQRPLAECGVPAHAAAG